MADNTAEYFSAGALRSACENAGTTQRVIADRLGITPTTLSSLRTGRSTPSMKNLQKMVEVFGGELTDFLDLPPRPRWELKHYRLAAGLTQAALASILDTAPSAVSGWELGKTPPSKQMLPRMAEVFGITEDKLRAVIRRQLAHAAGSATAEPSNVTLVLAETLAETVLGFITTTTATMAADHGISAEARAQLKAELRSHAEETLSLLATLIPQLPEDSRTRIIRLVGRLSAMYDTTLCV
ncbi:MULTISPECIES: helix-turn-helix transcriptional regulator [Mycolicibacter]|uniref:Helix-turn-helix transcriptional regulator n=2 Tax=Mycolicibacter TaxID=1073531 RepID=A0ABU5XNB4_9MYCO|nr:MULTISPECIES: helix-turn-helix transcriptional regulator [unclassified Mycolicibacter]MEB3023478.1 helix-turn-helix transcriptional regulator [Mycolicibacter sp. MYC098]MEB3035101.1 helix-turn-helix transcriptional regulator [Mycolicibacter sp. MYC340]